MSEAGHNSELTEAERKALSFHHFRAISAQKAKVQEQQAEYRRLRKLAKADGIVLSDIDFMLRCADLEDPSIVPDELRRLTEIASWFALPVHFQPDLFVDRAPALERIEAEGVAAGLAGKNEDFAGYGPASPEDQASRKGWRAGQDTLLQNLQSAMEKKNSAALAAEDPDFPDEEAA